MHFATLADLTAFFYAAFDFFCAVIMGILVYTTIKDVERTNKRIHLLTVLISVGLYCVSDAFWVQAYCDSGIGRSLAARYATNVIMYAVMAFVAYAICRFFLSVWEAVQNRKIIHRHMIFAPFGIAIIAVLSTPWTHLFFSIAHDENFTLVAEPFYHILIALFFGFVIVFGLISLIFYFRTENDFSKEQYLLVALYSIPVVIGGIFKLVVFTFPSFAIGLTIATFIIYIFQMRDLISLDALTGINNRRQGERFFVDQINRINEEPHSTIDCLYLFMMDLNKFKLINDTYGHNEGDVALVATADVIKEACSHIRRKCIMSRFGGDEFVIGVVFTPEEAHFLNEKIHTLIQKKNEELKKPYKISISVGFTYYKREYKNFRTFLTNADKLMYEMKEIAHREAELDTLKN